MSLGIGGGPSHADDVRQQLKSVLDGWSHVMPKLGDALLEFGGKLEHGETFPVGPADNYKRPGVIGAIANARP
jgi:hypothetical protein